MNNIEIYTDAAWDCHNKKPYFRYGIIICDNEKEEKFVGCININSVKKTYQRFDIHIAEMISIIKSLETIKENTDVSIYTDSLSSFNVFNNISCGTKYDKIKKVYLNIVETLQLKNINIDVRWIPGHDGVWGNEMADRLCEYDTPALGLNSKAILYENKECCHNDNFGRIKFFNKSKGFGFIIDSKTNNDIFVHAASLIDRKMKMKPNSLVSYTIKNINGKKVADLVAAA